MTRFPVLALAVFLMLVLQPGARAQTNSASPLDKEIASYFEPCSQATATDQASCEIAHKVFSKYYRRSLNKNDHDAQLYVAQAFEQGGDYFMKPDQVLACAWRAYLLFHAPDPHGYTKMHVDMDCGTLSPAQKDKATVAATLFFARIKTMTTPDEEPQIPIN